MQIDIFAMLTEMAAHGVENNEVARRLRTSTGTVQHWKAGRAKPRLETGLQLILLYYEVLGATEVQVFASTQAYKLVVTPTV